MRIIAFLLMLLVPPSVDAAGRVFYDGFEDGTTNAWVADGSRNKCTVVTSALDAGLGPYAGTKMAQCNWNGEVSFSDPESYLTLKLTSWSYTEEMFVRFRVRYDADVDQVNGGKAMRLEDGNNGMYWGVDMSSPTDDFTAYWEFIDGVQSPGSYVYWGNGENMGNGQWHKVEIYILARTNTTGALRIWVDDTLVKELTGIKTTGSGQHWYPMYVMSNWSSNPGWEHDANNHVYWDEMEIYSDTGTGGTGTMSDASITQGGGGGGGSSTGGSMDVRHVPQQNGLARTVSGR